jgi:hypothetical protein
MDDERTERAQDGPVRRALRMTMLGGLVLLAVGPWLLAWGDVPDPLATHFGPDGVADGKMSQVAALVFNGGGVLAGVLWLARAQQRRERAMAAIGAFFAGTFATVAMLLAFANRGVTDWEDARLPLARALLAMPIAAAFALAAGALEPRPIAPTMPTHLPGLPLRHSERVLWLGRARGSWWLWLPLVLTGVLVGANLDAPLVAVPAFGLVVVCSGLSSVRVGIDERGVRVRPAVVAWPRRQFDLEEIAAAHAIDLHPLEWGGWGYRGSLRLTGHAAWVVRRGPGLVLDLKDGGRFAVTVDDADEAAGVVNGLISRGAGRRGQLRATPRPG